MAETAAEIYKAQNTAPSPAATNAIAAAAAVAAAGGPYPAPLVNGKPLWMSGTYLADGYIWDEVARRVRSPSEFAGAAGNRANKPFHSIVLADEPRLNLFALEVEGGSTAARETAQVVHCAYDPLCAVCGGDESRTDNEILLCDGEGCGRALHQVLQKCACF
ncbi:hypothetical protein T492DRAFT_459961 [Pavlovales sp. CCMP2436]|nr:hypothetical protein T492DRAFT_459961 [Pavlovales sp. CCMP2436]